MLLNSAFVSKKSEAKLAPGEPDTASDATPFCGRILLAEDNSINQLYVAELMKLSGCAYDVVANGREAVAAVLRRHYDLVLMDCQMPEMDGFEATRRIRQLESDGTLVRHIPILALTANAVKGDRERCLAAGMDDYLSKPMQKWEMAALLERFLDGKMDPSANSDYSPTTFDDASDPLEQSPIDAEKLLDCCFGNLECVSSLLDELESSGMSRVVEIERRTAQNNSAAAADAAHALKGAAGILCAESVQALAAEIEQAGRSSSIQEIEQ